MNCGCGGNCSECVGHAAGMHSYQGLFRVEQAVAASSLPAASYSAWVKPTSDAFLKKDYAEICDNEAYLDKDRYQDEDLVDSSKRQVPFEVFKSVVAAAPVKTLSQKEAVMLVTEAANGKMPKLEWLLHPETAPPKDWADDEQWRYTKENAAVLVPKFLDNQPIDMPIVLYHNGKPSFAAGGRHRMAYGATLGAPVKVVAITEEELALESGLLSPKGEQRLRATSAVESKHPSVYKVKAILPELCRIAQKEYDEWVVDPENPDDDELNGGGICHLIAEEIAGALAKHGLSVHVVSSHFEQHVYCVGAFVEGVFEIDLPYSVYETGGGYSWQKIEGVKIEPSDWVVHKLDADPGSLNMYLEDGDEVDEDEVLGSGGGPVGYKSFPLYGEAYDRHPKKNQGDRMLTHSCEVDADGFPVKVLCRKVKLSSICDDATQGEDAPPTCPVCLQKLAKLKAPVLAAAGRGPVRLADLSEETQAWLGEFLNKLQHPSPSKVVQDELRRVMPLSARTVVCRAFAYNPGVNDPAEDLRVGQTEPYHYNRPSSWTKDLDVAEDFGLSAFLGQNWVIKKVTADPKDVLCDTTLLDEDDRESIFPMDQREVIMMPGELRAQIHAICHDDDTGLKSTAEWPDSTVLGRATASAQTLSSEMVQAFCDALESKHQATLELRLTKASDRKDAVLKLDSIVVPKNGRGLGVGTKILKEIEDFADLHDCTVVLSPSKDLGASSVGRLKTFYGRFGFVSNSGKNKDFQFTEAMIRYPLGLSRSKHLDRLDRLERKVTSSITTWYHGRKVKDSTFDLEHLGEGYDQEGPGLYFSSSRQDAAAYAYPAGIIMEVELDLEPQLPKMAKTADVHKLISHAPDLESTLANWDENPKKALLTVQRAMMLEPKEAYQQVWIDFYRHNEKLFLNELVKLGYHSRVVEKNLGVKHAIVFDPKFVKVVKTEDSVRS